MEILDNIHDDRAKFKYYLNPLGTITMVVVALSMVVLVFRLIALFMMYKLFPEQPGMLSFEEGLRLQWWGNAVDSATMIYLFFFIVSMVPFFMWLYRAYANLEGIKQRGLNVTAGWAVGWFFIPIANLYYSVVVINDIMRGTKHRELDEPINNSIEYQNVPPWGAIWLIVRILGGVFSFLGLSSFIKNPQFSRFGSAITFESLSMLLVIVSGFIMFYIVYSVTKRQNHPKNF